MLIEIVENVLQISVLMICAGVALYSAAKDQSRTWMLAFFFYSTFVLGDIYWLVCLIFFGVSPQISIVSNLSWYGAYLFLYILLRQAFPVAENGKRHLLPWTGPAFSVIMAVYFMQWGDVLNNLITALLMGLISFSALSGLTGGARNKKQCLVYAGVFLFYLTEYALWISSCIWEYTPTSPYYWIDILLTACFPLLLFAIHKEAAA